MMLFLPCVQANRTWCVLHVCEDGRCVSSHDKHTSQPQPHYTSAHLWYLPAVRGSPGPGAARNGRQTSARHGGGRRELGHEVPQCDLGLANVSLKLLSTPFSHVNPETSAESSVCSLCFVSCRSPSDKEKAEMSEETSQSVSTQHRKAGDTTSS